MTMSTFSVARREIRRFVHCLPVCAALVLLIALPLPAKAQEGEPAPWLQVRIVEVKPDRTGEFEDLVKDLMAARAEAGMPAIMAYQVVRGDVGTYHFVEPLTNLGQLDEAPEPPMPPAEMAAWESRIVETLQSNRFFIARTYPDHSFQTDAAENAELMMLYIQHTHRDRGTAYEEWVAEDLVPALQEAEILGHTMSRGAIGDSGQTWYHAVPIANWAAFDEPDPIVAALGEDAAERLFRQGDKLVDSGENVLVRMRADLSSPTE